MPSPKLLSTHVPDGTLVKKAGHETIDVRLPKIVLLLSCCPPLNSAAVVKAIASKAKPAAFYTTHNTRLGHNTDHSDISFSFSL